MKQLLDNKLVLIFLVLIPFILHFRANSQVTYRDTLLSWNHFDYTLDENNGMDWYSTTNIVEDEYPGIVLENEFVRLVVLPDFGARIISFLYKPTGHEQFYTNPVGTPYGMGDGNFYYDWLMVFGGVFPTFPEPEHGKTWFLPWQWDLTEIGDDKVALKMEIQDTIDYPYHPGKFNNGITEVRCTSIITLERGKTSFELEHTLENTRSQSVTLEYWTCTTLAPGSEPGNTYTPGNSEIIAPIDHVYLKDDWWGWMGNAEIPAPELGSHVFEYKNLAIYDNWEDMGIAYAYPDITGGYYGVINHENSEGVFRVADNAGTTPGMKFWTWGAQQGLNANPQDFYENARPYIELWSGLSTQFFEDASLTPNELVSWTETYLPTVAMDSISLVNEHGAIHLNAVHDEADRFVAKLFMTTPDSVFELQVALNGDNTIDLYEGDFVAQSDNSSHFTFYLDDYTVEDGEYELMASVSNELGAQVITCSMPVTIPFPTNGIMPARASGPVAIRLSADTYKLEFDEFGSRTITVFSVDGKPVDKMQIHDKSAFIRIDRPGVYIILVTEGKKAYTVKIMIG